MEEDEAKEANQRKIDLLFTVWKAAHSGEALNIWKASSGSGEIRKRGRDLCRSSDAGIQARSTPNPFAHPM